MNAPQKPALLAKVITIGEQRGQGGDVCQPVRSRRVKRSCSRQILAVLRGLAPYAGRHKGTFFAGVCGSFGVVAAKLALPWPLRAVADSWQGNFSLALPQGLSPVIAMGGVFLLLSFSLGLFDMLQRLYFARFSLATVKDLRADAMAHAVAMRSTDHGDLVTLFVGDSKRVSSGMSTFLVHVLTSLILLLGMTVILFHMETTLGWIFTAASACTFVITLYIFRKIFISSMRTRKKESKRAKKLYAAIDAAAIEAVDEEDDADDEEPDTAVSDKSSKKSKSTSKAYHTHLQGISTWSAHAIFGIAVLSALWAGSEAVAAGRMSTGDMVVFMMYALMLQNPTVRLARQGAKCGKVFSSAYRLMQISHLSGGH